MFRMWRKINKSIILFLLLVSPCLAADGDQDGYPVIEGAQAIAVDTEFIRLGNDGVYISNDSDGAITLLGLGDGFDEDITFNLDDVENTLGISSSMGLVQIDTGSIDLWINDLQIGDGRYIGSDSQTDAIQIEADGDIILTDDLTIGGDDLFMATNTLGYVLVGDGTNFNPVEMNTDATIAADGAVTVANDSHSHTGATLSGIDISDDTNLAGTANQITLTDDTLSLELNKDLVTTSPLSGGTDNILIGADSDVTLLLSVSAADKYLYSDGVNSWTEGSITSAGRSMLSAANAAAQLTLLSGQAGSDFSFGSYDITAGTVKLTDLTDGYVPYHVSDASGLADSPISTDGTNVSIGTTSPDDKLEILHGISALKLFYDATYYSKIRAGSSGELYLKPQIGDVYVYRDSDTGRGRILLYSGSAYNTVIDGNGNSYFNSGNIGIGTSSPGGSGTVGTAVLSLANGTAPVGGVANQASIFAKDVSSSSELFGLDEAGNTPQLTNHNFTLFDPDSEEPYPFSYYAYNNYLGKEINVDMIGAIRAIEELSGKKFVYYNDIEKIDLGQAIVDKKEQWKQAWKEENVTEAKVELAEAIEPYEIDVDEEAEEIYIENGEAEIKKSKVVEEYKISYELNAETGELNEIKTPVYKTIKATKYRIKEGYIIDEETGEAFKKVYPTDEEAEIAAEEGFEDGIPDWIKARLTQ